jgi:hypothetical protein
MKMKNKIEQFKTIVKSEISDIDIGYKKFEDGYIQIYYYSEIDKKILFEVLGKALKSVFYNDGIFNIGLRKISKERIKEYFPEKNDILNFYTILEFEEILNTFSKTFKKNIASNYTDTYFAINKYNNMKLNKRSKLNKTKYNKPNIIYSNFS